MLNRLFKTILFILVISGLSISIIYADSPVTSTPFSEAYLDVDIVKKAKDSGLMNEEFAEYLSSKDNPIDIKAAVINALSWSIGGKENAVLYINLVYKKNYKKFSYKTIDKDLKFNNMTGEELFCIGYLRLMDDYFKPKVAAQILKKASLKIKDSFTVAIIYAIAKGQVAFDGEIWKAAEEVLNNKSLKKDMRDEAVKIIVDYLILYKEYCK